VGKKERPTEGNRGHAVPANERKKDPLRSGHRGGNLPPDKQGKKKRRYSPSPWGRGKKEKNSQIRPPRATTLLLKRKERLPLLPRRGKKKKGTSCCLLAKKPSHPSALYTQGKRKAPPKTRSPQPCPGKKKGKGRGRPTATHRPRKNEPHPVALV